MFDIIGKRRWFYAFSLLITIPGLIFILLTPITSGKEGLKFSIDFTGGTVWEIHFRDGTPTPHDVQTVMAAQGLPWVSGTVCCFVDPNWGGSDLTALVNPKRAGNR